MLSCGPHCSGHFLINATDKAVVFQLMQMQQATPSLKHPTAHRLPLSSDPNFLLNASEYHDSFPPFLGWLLPLGLWLTASSRHYCDPSSSSSVLRPITQPFSFILDPWSSNITLHMIKSEGLPLVVILPNSIPTGGCPARCACSLLVIL